MTLASLRACPRLFSCQEAWNRSNPTVATSFSPAHYTAQKHKNPCSILQDYLSSHAKIIYLVQTLPFFSYSLKEQMSRQKKIYCIDSGIRNAIGSTFSRDMGRTAENIVFLSLKRMGSEVFYWKNKKGWEVDFVVKSGLDVRELVQVCWDLSGESENGEVRSLNAAMGILI